MVVKFTIHTVFLTTYSFFKKVNDFFTISALLLINYKLPYFKSDLSKMK
ncbi:MAG: hypothetical protein ACJA1H_000512 [Glaciecola sp.]|jgi:hypothetical protein